MLLRLAGRLVGARRICTYGMDIFRLDPGGLWSRWEEVHEEYAYEPAELEALLRQPVSGRSDNTAS